MTTKKVFYDKAYAQESKIQDFDLPRVKRIVEAVGRNKKVLDLGCWDGKISNLIKKNDNKVIGVDLSIKALMLPHRNIDVVCADVERLAFKSETFDAVVGGEIIEHIFDTSGFLKEIRRVLKKSGVLVLSTPNLASLSNRTRMLLGMDLPAMEVELEDKSGHIRFFTFASLKRLLLKNGYRVTEMNTDIIIFPVIGHIFKKICYSERLARIFKGFGTTLVFTARKI